ncbi:MAG: DUF2330 domain-containing protein [Deltaproteobacteria bacterium]|nr:DUF2330 domain-containing protein [Deltaproteobacteria bacterium]
MLRTLTTLVLSTLVLVPRVALPCGGGFGDGLHIDPSQRILIAFRGTSETYVFNPHFCGQAAEFGLVLPVPGKLLANPSLADVKLFAELEALSAPRIEKRTACLGDRGVPEPGGWGGKGPDAGASQVTVVNKGQVGIFDWVLLKADTAAAFTDWLDANKFPYDKASAATFGHYVTQGWYFVAFKITADSKAPPPGSQLCGDLGPLTLAFETRTAVIPARIAALGGSASQPFGWRVFTLAAEQQRTLTKGVAGQLRFSGSLSSAQLAGTPELAKLALAGDRLTKLDLQFWGSALTGDISLEKDPAQADFRQTIYETTYVKCDAGPSGEAGPVKKDAGRTDAGPSPAPGSDARVSGPKFSGEEADTGCTVGGSDARLPLVLLTFVALAFGFGRRRKRG